MTSNYEWWELAACKDRDQEVFWRDRNVDDAKEAKAICRSCLVQKQCLRETLRVESGDPSGVFGNTTPRERNAMLKRVDGNVRALIEAIDREIQKAN